MRLPYDLAARQPFLQQDFDDAEYERRLAATRSAMARDGLDALIVYSGGTFSSARWLTNFQPIYGHSFVVVCADGRVTVTTNGLLHAEPMHSMIWTCRVDDVRCTPGPVYGRPADEVAILAADAASGARHVGLAGSSAIPHALWAPLKQRLPELRAADAVIAEARLIKSSAEIDRMATAGGIADAAFSAVFAQLVPGVEETEVAASAVEAMHRLGGREAFRTCVVGGELSGQKHAYPRMRELVRGEMVFVDLGAEFMGYASDTSRCGVVGEAPSGSAASLLSVAQDLYHAGLEHIRPGRTVDDVSKALARAVRGTRFEPDFYPSGFGHGIGMDLIETPGGLFAGMQFEFRPGMAFAYEPMVVVEGLGTGVIEDTLVITESGYRLLTNAARDMGLQ